MILTCQSAPPAVPASPPNASQAPAAGNARTAAVDAADRTESDRKLDAGRKPVEMLEFLGVKPGPVVGEALHFLLELRLDEGPMSEDEARTRLAAWARDRAARLEPSETGAAERPA